MPKAKPLFDAIFLSAVAILLANDAYFKYAFHNTFTGKLSDLAGLFAFPYFFSALLPKITRAIYILTGVLFLIWKSELVQPLIDFAQNTGINIGRTVDYTDLAALLMLPVSYKYLNRDGRLILPLPDVFGPAIVIVCCFAFVATSMPRTLIEINIKSYAIYKVKADRATVVDFVTVSGNDSTGYFSDVEISDRNAKFTCKVKISELDNTIITVGLDSIIDVSVEESGVFSSDYDENVEYVRNLKQKDFERLFYEKKIMPFQ